MAQSHANSKRTKTGAKRRTKRNKKKFELGSEPIEVKIGKRRAKKIRSRGGHKKIRLKQAKEANVLDPEKGTHETLEIKNVIENDANRHYVRRNILTKGAIIETEKGKAKITSRPGQHGTVNAVLLEED